MLSNKGCLDRLELFQRSIIQICLAFALLLALNAVPANAALVLDENCQEKVQTKLPLCQWRNDSEKPRACVLLMHGMTQRGCSLDKIARQIASQGYLVWALDQRGHGYWHFANDKHADGYIYNFKQSTGDVVTALKAIRQDYPDLRTFCIGESCGAAVIAKAAVEAPDLVNGLVLCSTGVKPCRVKTIWLLHDLLCNGYRINHPFSIVRYQAKYCSDCKADLPASQHDPWVRKMLSAKELFRVKTACCGTAKVAKHLDPNISLLIVEGSADHVLKPSSAKKILDNAKTSYKQLVTISGCGHVVLGTNYPRPLVVSTIDNWLNRETGSQTVARANSSVMQ